MSIEEVGVPVARQDSLQRWLRHVQENPVLYGAVLVFVALCGVAGLLYRMNVAASERAFMTRYAAALEIEDSKARLVELELLAQENNRWTPEIVYLAGETAVRAQAYDQAEAAFKRVREEFANSEYAATALDGMAFIAENRGGYEQALALYQEAAGNYANTFTGRRQALNIGRVQERLGDLEAAVASYESQLEMFPDSNTAGEAREALDRLKKEHPELFPDETVEQEALAEDLQGTAEAEPASDAGKIAEAVPSAEQSEETPGAPAEAAEADAETGPDKAVGAPEQQGQASPAEASEDTGAEEASPAPAGTQEAQETAETSGLPAGEAGSANAGTGPALEPEEGQAGMETAASSS